MLVLKLNKAVVEMEQCANVQGFWEMFFPDENGDVLALGGLPGNGTLEGAMVCCILLLDVCRALVPGTGERLNPV